MATNDTLTLNSTVGNTLFQSTSDNNKDCKFIKAGNASLAANWENIPETVILNGAIGALLFVTFVWLTYIGWRRADTEDKLRNQNIITYLYGYRDPEQWYVIPRLEFLRRGDRHHQHDLNYPYIYVPPKLPLANPLEIFDNSNDMEHSKSLDSGPDKPPIDCPAQTSPVLPTDKQIQVPQQNQHPQQSPNHNQNHNHNQHQTQNQHIQDKFKSTGSILSIKEINPSNKSAQSSDSTLSDSPIRAARTLMPKSPIRYKSSFGLTVTGIGSNSSSQANKSSNPEVSGTHSFFYPSILTAEQLQASPLSRRLNKFFSIFFRVTDADIIYARGIDAYEYLLFQRHLILILFIVSILCLGIILPIHWFAGSDANPSLVLTTSFQRSTIKNIATNTHLHWAHIVCSGVIVASALKIMGSYKDSIITPNGQQLSRRTLLIGNIPTAQRTRAKLLRVLRDYFPRNTIEAIQFVYDTSSLDDYEMYLSSTIVAKDYCQAYKRKHNSEIYVHDTDVNLGRVCSGYCRCCSFVYICCRYWPYEARQPGTTYYAKEEELYRDKIAKACEQLVREPTEYAFVTFKSHRQAKKVMEELANLKHDVLEGKRAGNSDSGSKSSSRSTATKVVPASGPAKAGELDTGKIVVEKEVLAKRQAQPTKSKSIKRPAPSKFIELGSNVESADLLDPKNNPHVRSIRIPPNTAAEATEKMTQAFLKKNGELNRGGKLLRHHQQQLDAAKHLIGPIMWSVRYAPHPDNVEFQDLLNMSRTSRYTIILWHALMVIIFIFITTPAVVLSMIERVSVLRPDKAVQLTGFEGLFINYFSILLQIITTAVLPALVTLISKQIPYEDSSSKGHSVMWKVYLFLILMVIIMPSIGMSSALAFFDTGIEPKCLFPTDNGAYYINYVISSIFLSTMLELIKPVDILSYYFILWTSRSTAEIEGGRQFIEREFSVGLQHTGVLVIFGVVMTYCISCPLIAPVGLIYLIVKHAVDHYNLYYTYFTKKVDKDMQSTIVIFVKVALLLMLFQPTVAIYVHTGTSYFSLIAQIIFCLTLAAFAFNCFFDCTSKSLPPSTKRARYQHDFCACFYLPKVISSLLRLSAIPSSCISRKV